VKKMQIEGLNGKVDIYTKKETAELLGMAERTLVEEMKRGNINPYKFGFVRLFTDKIIEEYKQGESYQRFLKRKN
jgi:hypothetical protein